jgi:hypothetical protein
VGRDHGQWIARTNADEQRLHRPSGEVSQTGAGDDADRRQGNAFADHHAGDRARLRAERATERCSSAR